MQLQKIAWTHLAHDRINKRVLISHKHYFFLSEAIIIFMFSRQNTRKIWTLFYIFLEKKLI